ncbi:AAA domain-containing protein [Streptomyces sp. CB03911]|uniref:AAA domain-containing protein n=1 Tax=Streptomyces sp. CB03911 TaxID=1804758 RepID=UPI000939F2AD|nr:AAA domain-containing protein [Streptomyces sp. CB03911]
MAGVERPYPTEEFLRACRAEIASARRHDGSARSADTVLLHSGRQTGGGELREYVFRCKNWRDTLDGRALLVRPEGSQRDWTPAEVTRGPDGAVRVLTAAELGTDRARAELREDDAGNWVALVKRLEAVGGPESRLETAMAGLLLDQGDAAVGQVPDPHRWVAGWHGLQLNDRQRRAVAQALGSRILFLWGPPGTGKTDVVSYIAEGCYRQGHRVLFLAPTNVAVDQALERICELLERESGFDSGLVQRAGRLVVPSLVRRFGEQVDEERIAARVNAGIDARLARAKPELDGVRAALARHDEARRLTESLDGARARQRAAAAERDEAGHRLLVADAAAAALRLQLARATPAQGWLADRKQAKLDELRAELTGQIEATEAAARTQREAAARATRAEAGIPALEAQRQRAAAELAGTPPRGELAARAEALHQQIQELDAERRRLQDTVRSRCRVLGTTVARAVQSRRLMDEIDVVVIDEAGMVDLPSAWVAAGLAGKRVVVAGDFRQLPAVTKAAGDDADKDQQPHSRQWAARDAFHAAGLVGTDGAARGGDPRLVGLDTQYRMHPAVCGLVNAVAYPDAPLRTGRPDGSRLPSSPLLPGPLVLLDTSGQRVPGGGSGAHRTNAVHEAVIHELVRGLQYDGVLPARVSGAADGVPGPGAQLAVIAPYKDQVRRLSEGLRHRFGEEYEGLVDTVHRFQGSQRPLVVIDMVAGAGAKPGFFYEGTGLSSTTTRLLNVAASRAQDHLVVVADVAHLREHLAPHSEALVMLDHLERHAVRLPVEELVPVRQAAELAGLAEDELARPAFFPADEVGRAVSWDLGRAVTSIDVFCAFLNAKAVDHWIGPLAERAAAGVTVTVHTRDHRGDTRATWLVERLGRSGITVLQRERMHEKVLIVDDTVLWHGSLNLLAKIGPTDLMMRLTDPESCRRVRRIMAQARPADENRWERPGGADPRARAVAPALPGAAPAPAPAPATASSAAPVATGATGAPTGTAPGDVVDGRLYLKVPYQEKDEARRLVRARWDGKLKLWWVDAAGTDRAAVRRWLP